MSDTPITDNACGWPFGQHGLIESTILSKNAAGPFVHASVARELERENAALRELAERMATEMCEIDHEFASLRDYYAARKEAQP